MGRRATTTQSLLCTAAMLLHASSGLAETATIISSAPLHQHPAYNAPVIGQLDAGASVQPGQRTGGWKKVATDNKSGWVRSYHVRSGNLTTVKQGGSSGGFLGGLAGLSRKASGLFSGNQNKGRRSYESVATIGVRGLSEEEIKNARPDIKELEKMERFRVSNSSAKSYARKGLRTSMKLDHMPRSAVEK